MTPLILWDVDQTLLYTGGAGSLAMKRAFEQLYGVADGFARVEFSGRTDWSILKTAMEQHGLLDDDAAFDRERQRFQETYYGLLPNTLVEIQGRVMPGVPELLRAFADRDVKQGLATGNFRKAAFMKLDHFGLDGYLHEGGFGDDAEVRADLVAVAIERLSNGSGSDVWVIGDTPLDIEAAHANGAMALGVATGQRSVDELRSDGGDIVLQDLADTDAVLAALLG